MKKFRGVLKFGHFADLRTRGVSHSWLQPPFQAALARSSLRAPRIACAYFCKQVLAPLLILAGCAFAQQPYGSIQRLNPKLNAILPPGTKVMRVATGFKWIEGPVWVPASGYLLFAEITINSIGKWQPHRGVSIFMHPSGYQGT
ncbi:MAG: hypothetical protein ACRD4O_18575, partial [Bryobacteraceae bacterium]